MKKSICIETIFTEFRFEERFEQARLAGFDYVEFWTWKDKDLQLVKSLCEKFGLQIASFSGDRDFSLIDPSQCADYVEFVKQSVQAAKLLNCKQLVLHSNALGEGGVVLNDYAELGEMTKYVTMYNVLREVAPLAEEAGITLVIEALNDQVDHVGNFLVHTRQTAEMVKLVGSPFIKVLYDVYHMQITEGNIVDTLTSCADVIGYVHIADVPGRHEPGTGEINFAKVMETLRTIGYNGYIGFELFPASSSSAAAASIREL